jgi:hypothetical protein
MQRTALYIVYAMVGLVVSLASCKPQYRDGYDPSKNVFSATTLKVLEQGDRFVLLSLNPKNINGWEEQVPRPKSSFHYYEVLGKVEIQDPKERIELLQALFKGMSDSTGTSYACFNPRHGIRATLGKETVDLVICFECGSLVIHASDETSLFVSQTPIPTFNRILENAGLPVATEH